MDRYKVKPGSRVDLAKRDPNDTGAQKGSREKAEETLLQLSQGLAGLQELLYAEHKHKVLIVLQAMDTGGKDGTIRHVFGPLNPQGARVASFKKPSLQELDHDYLWRTHREAPGKGEIVVFNRSHYEDVLVVRVHNLVDKPTWTRRYDQINDFERMLSEEGTIILKFYLHIDLDEQKRRLEDRINDPKKHWKLSPSDLPERKLWSEYMEAYEDAIAKTSTKGAPWYIVPANHKWYRNLVISSVVVSALKRLKMQYPKPQVDVAGLKID